MTDHRHVLTFLKKWMHADPNVIRVHISHNDLDGYGCNVVLGWALDCADDARASDVRRNINAGNENFANEIAQIITVKNATYYLLVTDLNIDPQPLVTLQEEGYHVEFAIIDHHMSSRRYADHFQNDTGLYYVKRGASASKMLLDIMLPYLRQINNDVIPEVAPAYYGPHDFDHVAAAMEQYVEDVSNFDLGLFGDWYDRSYDELPDSIREQCLFAYAVNVRHNVDGYLGFRRRTLTLFGDGCELSWNDARTYFKRLRKEYDEFDTDLIPRYTSLPYLDIIKGDPHSPSTMMSFPTFQVVVHNNGKPVDDFTLVSKEWTTRHPDVYLLVYVNMQRRTVELRSGADGANCAKIAMANGGGGHARAAGFPLK